MPKVSFDGSSRIINVTQVPVGGYIDLDVKADLYSDWKEWVLQNDNSKFPMAMSAVGGDPLPGSKVLGSTFFLTNSWRIRPYEENHVLRVDGNLYRDDGSSPFVYTLGSHNVMVINTVSAISETTVVTTGGSALTQQEHDKLLSLSDGTTVANNVWDETQSGHVSVGTFGKYLDSQISQISVSGVSDWTLDERKQIRHRLGVDGTSVAPSATPSLAMEANVEGHMTASLTAYDPPTKEELEDELDGVESAIRGIDGDTLKIISDQLDLKADGTSVQTIMNKMPSGIIAETGEYTASLVAIDNNISTKADGTSMQKIINKLPIGLISEYGEYDAELVAIQADLDNPSQYKADVSGLALESTAQSIKGKTDVINWTDITFMKDIEGGMWKIVNNQMIFYKSDNSTEVARFNLYDSTGQPTSQNAVERQRV